MKLKVSVIVTVLNEAQTITKLITALSNQTHPADEIIIVDGGSNDPTWEVLKALQKHTENLTIFAQKGNRSLGRNYAISQAKNELIAITDAGCIPDTNWLEELADKYQETQAPVVAGYYNAQPTTAFQTAIVPYVLVMPDKVNAAEFLPATRSMLLEKSVWKKVGGFDEKLADNEDYAFAHQLRRHTVPIAFTRHAVVAWLPPSNIRSFFWMIFRFARGDIYAKLLRPKVVLVFTRYIFLVTVIGASLWLKTSAFLLWFVVAGSLLYAAWAIRKNYRYVPNGWMWLVILQYTADLAVMSGSLAGGIKLLKKLF